jgi:uncharacterized protein (TIGR00661 family)
MSQALKTLKRRVLVVPLDWGLGHATRCIPMVKALLRNNCTVILAGEGKTKVLLQKEFPQLAFLSLPGYRIHYSESKWALPVSIAFQIPKLLFSIKKENAWLRNTVEEHSIDAVISDNRYGLHHSTVPSVFVTHQLFIRTPFGKIADAYLQRFNYKYINRFSECWVPDVKEENNLAGGLSRPKQLPSVPVKYIGRLSRFVKVANDDLKHLLVLISGPEPQRTILETLLLNGLKSYTKPVVFVRGLPGNAEEIKGSQNITIYNHLPSEELLQKFDEAFLVISRCGYSTVMDLATLQKKSILIPTPGQTEQEYLAKHLMKNNFALCIEQKKFNINAALDLASKFDYRFPDFSDENKLDAIIKNFVSTLNKKQETNPGNPLS